MSSEYQPLQMTFVADPPTDMSVRLINILQRQCEVDEPTKQAVLLASQFIVNKYAPNTKEKTEL